MAISWEPFLSGLLNSSGGILPHIIASVYLLSWTDRQGDHTFLRNLGKHFASCFPEILAYFVRNLQLHQARELTSEPEFSASDVSMGFCFAYSSTDVCTT